MLNCFEGKNYVGIVFIKLIDLLLINNKLLPKPLMADSIIAQRITETHKCIDENPELKQLIIDNQSFWRDIKGYSIQQLVAEIQPKWHKQSSLSEKKAKELILLLLEYRLRGLDIEYFKSGAGAPGSCSIQ